MRRPIRTRPLSIAAIMSFLAFVVVAGAGARSYWVYNGWECGRFRFGELECGRVAYERLSGGIFDTMADRSRYFSRNAIPVDMLSTLKFDLVNANQDGEIKVFIVRVPLWPLLLLLLIAPALWLIARSLGVPAFPVVTKQP